MLPNPFKGLTTIPDVVETLSREIQRMFLEEMVWEGPENAIEYRENRIAALESMAKEKLIWLR
jgi:hypothetical protein